MSEVEQITAKASEKNIWFLIRREISEKLIMKKLILKFHSGAPKLGN